MNIEMDAADVPKVTEELDADAIVANRIKRKNHRRNGPKSGPAALKRRDRIVEALRLRRDEGKTWEQIAPLTGFNSKQTVYSACMKFLDKRDMDEIDLYRDVEYSRLEKASEVIMGVITDDLGVVGLIDENLIDEMDGYRRSKYLDDLADRVAGRIETKLKAIDRLVTVGTRTGKILGYDAPTKLEGNGMGGDITVTFAPAMDKPAEMAEPELIIEPEN